MTEAEKRHLRRHFTTLRDTLTAQDRIAAEAVIRKTLFDLPAWKNATLICGYMSIRSEIDTAPIWERAAAEGKDYALPVTLTSAREGQMIFRRMAGYTPEELVPARFGVLEPDETRPVLTAEDFAHALILVPGLAFDQEGYRLGYGGGYYDRFLARLQAERVPFTTIGLVFSDCRTDALPREAHDFPVDIILDERRTTVTHGIPEPQHGRND